ncbi:efflux RND transporter periplasmic adaptor subunit [Chromatiaceae bacterium AAb-1]|nr:efflux RND transporter periplasmic adaptor subunit [Chromatiaceae bacterium AAb-1]
MKTSPSILLAILAVTGGSLLLSGCKQANSSPAAATAEAVMAIPVEASLVSRGEISSTYRTTATLEARAEAEVISKATGIVQQILVEEGEQVEAGQLLAQLDNERQQYHLAKEKAELNRLSSELKRMQEMYQRQLISADVFEKLQWQHDALSATVKTAELALQETEIRAPISGVISRRYAKIGQLVNQHTIHSLFHIVSNKELEAVIHLPEQQLAQARIGQKALLQFAGMTPFTAELVRVSPVVDASSGTARATLRVDNSQQQLKPGMFAQVQLHYDVKARALLLPKRALMTTDNTLTVFAIDPEGKVKRKVVHTGYQSDTTVEILEGLDEGDSIVIAGQSALKDDSLVNIITVRDF